MPTLAQRLLFTTLMLGGCFAAQALIGSDSRDGASVAQLERLTQRLALCPERANEVAVALDEAEGWLSAPQARAMIADLGQCRTNLAHRGSSLRYQQAYSSLKSVVYANSLPPLPQGVALRLSAFLSSATR